MEKNTITTVATRVSLVIIFLTLLIGTPRLFLAAPAKNLPYVAGAGYIAQDEDFQVLLEGISAAMNVQGELFPHDIREIDVVLYDAKNAYVFSHNALYDLKRRGNLQEYSIYQTAHGGKMSEKELGRCGDAPDAVATSLAGRIPRNYVACAPRASFERFQKSQNKVYGYWEGYFASIIHEFARAYMRQELWQIPQVMDFVDRVQRIKTKQSKEMILREAYATWCELKATDKLYPDHARRLRNDFYIPGLDDPRHLGLKLALEIFY